MDEIPPHLIYAAHTLLARNETGNSTVASGSNVKDTRPPVYKVIGLSLAIASGLFIGTSFVLKKVGLLKANAKYNEEAGEGYGYLKNAFWWGGMTLMILGEICNFVAYAFTDAILVTPLGALSVVVTTILSAIFLKERLSFVGKIGCFNCIIGSIVIVVNAPEQSAVADIQEMKHFVVAPGFLTYTGLVVVGSLFVALWAGPRYGKKSMFVYLSVCSFIGGLSVVATQGLGAAVVAQAGKGNQFNQWFLYVLLVFVVATLLTEIVYLNKALNIFNAALVTPTYYVFFTSTTIVTSAILFRGFHGTGTQIATVVMGFLQICSGVVLLQFSKSAKDVPDAAVFKGDLDQVREVAEQEQAESEPKADAIRGTASIIRRMSTARQRMEQAEARRLREEKMADQLEPLREGEVVEWDGLRRRKTLVSDGPSASSSLRRKTLHPPLGMSKFPDLEDDDQQDKEGQSFFISVRDRAQSLLHPTREQHTMSEPAGRPSTAFPVALTEIAIPHSKSASPAIPYGPGSFEEAQEHIFGHPVSTAPSAIPSPRSKPLPAQPLSSPRTRARRQFSFTNFLRPSRQPEPDAEDLPPPTRPTLSSRGSASSEQRKAMKTATEEERLGLVKGDSHRGLLESSPERGRDPIPSSPSSPEMIHFPSIHQQAQPYPSHGGQRTGLSQAGQRSRDPSPLAPITKPQSSGAATLNVPSAATKTAASSAQSQPRQTVRRVTFSSSDQPQTLPNRSDPNLPSAIRPGSRQATGETSSFGQSLTLTKTPEQMEVDDSGSNKDRFAEQSAKEREERRQRKRQSQGGPGGQGSTDTGGAGFI